MKFLLYPYLENDIAKPKEKLFWISFFCKALYGFLMIKLIFLIPITNDLNEFYPFAFNTTLDAILYAPLKIFQTGHMIFFTLFALLLISGIILEINYFSALFIFWFSFSFSRLTFPINNGSDSVLNLFLMITILLPMKPWLFSRKWQAQLSNAALLLAQIQVALIYFISGYDKIGSQAYRSGAAIHSISNLTFHSNSLIHVSLSEFQCFVISWLIILFELGFSILIWFNKLRVPMLTLGVLFHLGIVFFLGLADFGVVMILCYALFLPIQEESAKKLVMANG
ncbi:MAG: hypothetical protein WAU36_19485 [Cyclobacteriaceae bacterium]